MLACFQNYLILLCKKKKLTVVFILCAALVIRQLSFLPVLFLIFKRDTTPSLRIIETQSFDQSEYLNATEEAERCANYGWNYTNRTARRRIFMGGLLADDTWDPLEAIAAEAYAIYHSVAFVESNTTQSYFPRKLRFVPGSENLARLQGGMFGPDTIVTVDFYYDSLDPEQNSKDELTREHMQREMIAPRWKANGMQPDDIGVVMDADETFTHDFLRALQSCDVPQFRPGQDCLAPKILASNLIFEGSPDCIRIDKEWYHPDVVLGECIDYIGNETLHKPALRVFRGTHGKREYGYGRANDDDKAPITKYERMPNTTMYPLLNTGDFRNYEGGKQIKMRGKYDWDSAKKNMNQKVFRWTGYHVHNFFNDTFSLRQKYFTYGHPIKYAFKKPLEELNKDLKSVVNCALGRPDQNLFNGNLEQLIGPRPVFFTDEYRKRRHQKLRQIIEEDEAIYRNNVSDFESSD